MSNIYTSAFPPRAMVSVKLDFNLLKAKTPIPMRTYLLLCHYRHEGHILLMGYWDNEENEWISLDRNYHLEQFEIEVLAFANITGLDKTLVQEFQLNASP